MATLTTTLDSDFTPAAGDFIVQVTGAMVNLVRKNTAGAAFALVQSIGPNTALVVSNPVAGAVYQFKTVAPTGYATALVQADQ